jgi:hypothetical protein
MVSNWHAVSTQSCRGVGHRWRLLAILAGSLAGVTAHAANLSFLSNSPIAYFQAEDTDLMMQNARKVLDSPDPAAKQSWSNPKTGASGSAEAVGQFKASDGAPCKRLRLVNKIKNMEGEATYTVCNYPKRGWVVNTDAQPAGG